MQMQCVMDWFREKGVSTWLTALPLEELGFSLHKGTFRDALCLRMAGSLHTYHLTVHVVSSKQLSMLSAAHMEGSQH